MSTAARPLTLVRADATPAPAAGAVAAVAVDAADAAWLAAAFAPAALGARYQLVRELGRGATGVVVLARERMLHRAVALKLLHPALARSEAAREAFRREARILAQLTPHAGVPVCLGYEEVAGAVGAPPIACLAMAYAPGETLAARLAREGRLPWREGVALLGTLAATLEHTHRRGVLHRDLKPENVLLAADDDGSGEVAPTGTATRLVLTDFGLAALPSHDDPRLAERSAGTPCYMAPEQFAGEHATDPRTDVYALGALGYAVLTGAPPYRGRSDGELAAQHLAHTVPALAARAPGLPPAVAAVVERCLAKAPEDRWPSAAAFAAALAAAAGPPPERRGRDRWPFMWPPMWPFTSPTGRGGRPGAPRAA